MITLSRLQVLQLRGVFRRAALGVAPRGPAPPVAFHAGAAGLRAECGHDGTSLSYHLVEGPSPPGVIRLPLDALADLAGRDGSPVGLESDGPDRTLARWADRGVPQSRVYEVTAVGPSDAPDVPHSWSASTPALLDALAEAHATGAEDSTRYALDCVMLRARGEVVATDGRQLLTHGGFAFPWDADLLVKRSPVFRGRHLPRDLPVVVGRTDAHVVLRVGPCSVAMRVQTGRRFPDADRVTPGRDSARTVLRLDPADAAFLGAALGRLPGDGDDAPATVELNGRVAVRARGEGGGPATELVLSRSGYSGPPARLVTGRGFLARALGLGFREFEVGGPDDPVACRDGRRVYAWQPLPASSAVPHGDDAARVDSASVTPGETHERPSPAGTHSTSSATAGGARAERTRSADGLATPTPDAAARLEDGAERIQAPEGVPTAAGLADLIAEAESLQATLADARNRAARLAVALRRHRRRERLVASTLASIRGLGLAGLAG